MKNILPWLWQTSKGLRLQSVINALIGVVTVAVDFAFIYATKWTIDIATLRAAEGSLTVAAAVLVVIIALQIGMTFARRWVAALLGVRSQNHMQLRLFRRILACEWRGLEARHSGDTLNRLERDVSDVTSVITDTFPAALGTLVRLGGAFLFLYTMDARLAVVVVLILPVFIGLSRIYVRRMRRLTREIRQTDSRIQSLLTESIQHSIVLKTLERTGLMAARLDEAQTHLRAQIRHRTLFSSFSATLLSMGFATGYLITFLWGVTRLHEGTITYGMMIAFIQLVGQIQGPFRELTKFVPVIISAFTASERLMELEDVPLEPEGEPLRLGASAGIRLTDVTFAYDPARRDILRHFSFTFPRGSSTAILGETGAGKTTLVRLILALVRPQEGRVELFDDERSVAASPLTRCNLVYVPQGNTLMSGTVRDNLLLARPTATDEEMREALRTACADFILARPDGLDQRVGEGGIGLSEGQAQRISIARALLRRGSILLLDEATSALDPATEQRLLQNLTQGLAARCTLLFITHRPAVVAHCTQTLTLRHE